LKDEQEPLDAVTTCEDTDKQFHIDVNEHNGYHTRARSHAQHQSGSLVCQCQAQSPHRVLN